jgi:hypothetical protein
MNYVSRMIRKKGSYYLVLKGIDDLVPVSRQYTRIVRETLSGNLNER